MHHKDNAFNINGELDLNVVEETLRRYVVVPECWRTFWGIWHAWKDTLKQQGMVVEKENGKYVVSVSKAVFSKV